MTPLRKLILFASLTSFARRLMLRLGGWDLFDVDFFPIDDIEAIINDRDCASGQSNMATEVQLRVTGRADYSYGESWGYECEVWMRDYKMPQLGGPSIPKQ